MRGLAAALALAAAPVCAEGLPEAALGAGIVVLGEVHDNPAHHAVQAEVVAALSPTAIVWEMMPPDAERLLSGIDLADAEALAQALDWEARGWPDFAMYHPIFLAAPGAAHVGAELPRDEVRAAMSGGAAAVWGEGAELWGLGPLDPGDLAARLAEQDEAHCSALPEEMLPGMVEVQRLRDATLARAAAIALDTFGAPVVVITGSGHARTDRGVPAALRTARPDIAVWSLGQIELDPGAAADPDLPFDLVLAAPPVPREDPCAAFR